MTPLADVRGGRGHSDILRPGFIAAAFHGTAPPGGFIVHFWGLVDVIWEILWGLWGWILDIFVVFLNGFGKPF